METIAVPAFVVKDGYNIDVPYKYRLKYHSDDVYVNNFFTISNNTICPKPQFIDYIKTVSSSEVMISFVVTNDASVAGRRYQESYICQTPLCYGYDDLIRLFKMNVPYVRQRNLEQTIMEPLVPELCAQYFILKALIESSSVDKQKSIILTLGPKSLKICYSFNQPSLNYNDTMVKIDYFDIWADINFRDVSVAFEQYVKRHRSTYRFSFYEGMQSLEILYNVRKSTFKKYANSKDVHPLLTKAEYDIYNFILDRGGATAQLIADEFGYRSSRVVRYHLKKMITLKLIKKIGDRGSHNVIYRSV